jgi:hypothetical protein
MLDAVMGIHDGRTVRVERGVFARKEGKWWMDGACMTEL